MIHTYIHIGCSDQSFTLKTARGISHASRVQVYIDVEIDLSSEALYNIQVSARAEVSRGERAEHEDHENCTHST